MILDDSPVEFVPWPGDFPDGWAYVGTQASRDLREAVITQFRKIPRALVDPMIVRAAIPFEPDTFGNYTVFRPVMLCAPQDILNKYYNFGGLAGIYLGSGHTAVTAADFVPVHEWGHMVDMEWIARTTGRQQTSANALHSRSDVKQLFAEIEPLLPAGTYAKTNILEWFAEFFDAWARRDSYKQASTTSYPIITGGFDMFSSPLTRRARSIFAKILPFDGMNDWLPRGIVDSPPVRTTPSGSRHVLFALGRGVPEPTLQWWTSTTPAGGEAGPWTEIPGATSPPEIVAPIGNAGDRIRYQLYATNRVGTTPVGGRDVIIGPVASDVPEPYLAVGTIRTVRQGDTVQLVAAASGSPLPTVQWQYKVNGVGSWLDIIGAVGESYIFIAVRHSGDPHKYRALFSNSSGNTGTDRFDGGCTIVVLAPA